MLRIFRQKAHSFCSVPLFKRTPMHLEKIPPFKGELINVVIETPRGSRYKYTYEEELDVFKLKKTMPLGSSFPFDFGFIPNTHAEDGDPIDVLVVMDEPAYPGSLVTCRLIGVLEAKQKERNGAEGRNDRIVAVAEKSVLYGEIKNLRDLSQSMEDQISQFFVNYNEQAGKVFTPLRWSDAAAAMELIKQGLKASSF
jgi:inorganic pyrophosphatase